MAYPYCLVVVDMQPEFQETALPVVDSVIKLVKTAMADGAYILFVEYQVPGIPHKNNRTFHEILAACENYENQGVVTKRRDDGGDVVLEYLNGDAELCDVKSLHFCGVNFEYCVFQTVITIARTTSHEITLHANACNGPKHDSGWIIPDEDCELYEDCDYPDWEYAHDEYVNNGVMLVGH